LPFVVGFDHDRADEAEQGFGVGEDADDVGAALDLLVQPLERQALAQVSDFRLLAVRGRSELTHKTTGSIPVPPPGISRSWLYQAHQHCPTSR
jgi:hypothetical protein